jgi:hypothetical protein
LPWVDSAHKEYFNEKDRSFSWPLGGNISTALGKGQGALTKDNRDLKGGTREVRQLPFNKHIFSEICKKFYVHSSISRAISRADVPLFSQYKVEMGREYPDEHDHSAIGND